jgi:hypothetical protein
VVDRIDPGMTVSVVSRHPFTPCALAAVGIPQNTSNCLGKCREAHKSFYFEFLSSSVIEGFNKISYLQFLPDTHP